MPLTFWILSGLAAALTRFSYRDVFVGCRAALITGFVTGNLFFVLPMLVEGARRMFAESRPADATREDTESYVRVLIPTSFTFPNVGKLLTLLFVLFAWWMTGSISNAPTASWTCSTTNGSRASNRRGRAHAGW